MEGVRKRIILKSLKIAYSFAVKWFLGSFMGSVGTFFFCFSYFKIELWISILLGISFIFVAFAYRFILTFRTEYRFEKQRLNWDNPYGDAILLLRDAFAAIHELRKMKSPSSKELIETLTFVCGKIKEIFDKKTNYPCSTCIKVVKDDSTIGVKTELITLCRDPKTKSNRKRIAIDKQTDLQNVIFKNTRFLNFFNFLGQEKGKFYMNNNLINTNGYTSVTLEYHGELPYKSEIVVPISPLNCNHTQEKPLLYGFLCVDSDGVDIFNDKYDVGLLQGVADGIFDIIHLYIQQSKAVSSDLV